MREHRFSSAGCRGCEKKVHDLKVGKKNILKEATNSNR